MTITRRKFGILSAGALGSSLTRSIWAREASSAVGSRYFSFDLISNQES
ncbi:MAG TPA: hypothetical protein VGT08_13945 [Terracidiphilus sp.]|nr:hypothetical protein [Terracidiphilus sp.]